ncbi:MAG: OB-fold domain-containing protein [Halioglobus sp.]|nr:OB-fold domain-containing protein [Halioglobus sp.]
MSTGVLAFGAYLPQRRLQRQAIAAAHAWFEPSLAALARGERSMGGWDEDSNTLSVEAARACLAAQDRQQVNSLYIGSTSFPFLDRQNAALVAEALSLSPNLRTFDLASSRKAGTSALLAACEGDFHGGSALVIASDKRRTKAASSAEMTYGDGAAAVLVGEGDVLAELVGSHTLSVDFIDHFRTGESEFDYHWEARWVREEGVMKIVPEAVTALLHRTAVGASDIRHFCCPVGSAREQAALVHALGISADALVDNLETHCGNTGAAHPVLMLVGALEAAQPGQLILVAGFGQGCDVLLFRATEALARQSSGGGLQANLANRLEESNYFKFLSFNRLITMEHGIRAETDKNTGLSTAYRNRALTTGFHGGRCRECGTLQIPMAPICVNPDCAAVDSQDPHPFADAAAVLRSYTSDRLTYSPNPPAWYGMIQFEQGGRIMIDFTDVQVERGLHVGMPMRMVFRVRDYDHKRGFRRYYWKAAPVYQDQGD